MNRQLIFVVAFVLVACVYVAYAGRDYYDVLGVSRDASQSEIKRAYRKLAPVLHPDKSGDEAGYIELTTAYEVLSDDEKRRVYDQHGEEGLKQGGHHDFNNPFDIFSAFGGGGGFRFNSNQQQQQQQQQRGPDIEIDLEVTLRDLYVGRTLKVAYSRQVLCHKCRGTGAKKAGDVQTCPVCKGSGMRVKVQQLGPGFVQQTQTVCDECGGKGKKVTSTCPYCKGKKVESGEDSLTVIVEQGMADGQQITFKQEGDESPDVTPGDLIFRVTTAPHKRFQRRGNDLYHNLTISLLEALTGFTKKVKHLDGHIVDVTRVEVTKPGFVLTIPEEGMPHHNYPSQKGNLFIEFTVQFPSTLTQEQKDGFKQLLQK